MRLFPELSIRQKLRRVVTVVSIFSGVFILVTLTGLEVLEIRQDARKKLEMLAGVLGTAALPALLFDDPKAAIEELARLDTVPDVVSANIALPSGEVFASYYKDAPRGNNTFADTENTFLYGEISLPLSLDNERAGQLSIRVDLRTAYRSIVARSAVIGGITALGVFLTLGLFIRLERTLTTPLLRLTRLIKTVTQDRDYSVRATKHVNDEVGTLVDGFNQMLAGIAARDVELERYGQSLEKQVVERTAELQEVNARLAVELEEHKRTEERLRQYAKVFEKTADGVIILDKDARVVAVNRSFTEVAGYAEDETFGKNPRFLQSTRHDPAFFKAMWTSILDTDHWQGEIWNRRKSGETYPAWLTISVIKDEQGQISNYIGVYSEINVLKKAHARLQHMAHHDALTGLPNRVLLGDRIEHALERARRERNAMALLFVDLDRFKYVNDTLGHQAGDQLLLKVSERLVASVRASDTVTRLGGDEFVVLLEDIEDPQKECAAVAEKVLDTLRLPITVNNQPLFIGASVGISTFPADGNDVDTLLKHADAAMYHAKAAGRNAYRFYTAELTKRAHEHLMLEHDLRLALNQGELELYYQPQIVLQTGQVIGAEALIRWRHPRLGLVTPASFIPYAEDTGLIEPIGAWVLQSACAQSAAWQAAGLPRLRVAVNLSAYHLDRDNLVDTITTALQETEAEPSCLELEITEGFFIKEPGKAIEVLHALKALGLTLAIDDFGTGYSSLAYLKRLPIDKLKIDGSFLSDLPHDKDDAGIVRSVIALAHGLRLSVTAEGVETRAQLNFLRLHECDDAQGHLISVPLPADEFQRWLERRSSPQVNGYLTTMS